MNDSVKIIENGLVFTGDAQNHCGYLTLLIQNGRINEMGKPTGVLKALYPAAEVIDATGKILLPGFVDAHYSGESSILRYLTFGQTMARWNKSSMIRRAFDYIQENATYEEFLDLYRLAYFSALKSGITTLVEFGIDNPEYSFAAAHEAMLQANMKGFIGLRNGDQIEAAQKLRDTPIRFALVIANEEDLTIYNLQTTTRLGQENKWPIILHLGQTRRAFDTVKKNFNKSIAQLYAEYHIFDYPAHLIHLACFEEGDIEFLAKSNVPLVLSPSAILQKGIDLPPFEELSKHKVLLALCSDWGVAEPLKNIQTYCSILRTLGLPIDKAVDLLALHTKNGAKVLGLETEIGSIETGKKADIVFMNMLDCRMNSIFASGNAERNLEIVLQEATSQQVSDVMINGEFYVREGHILTYSEEDLMRGGQALLRKLLQLGGEKSSVVQSSAKILKFSGQDKSVGESQANNLPYEEGFRVLRRSAMPSSSSDPITDKAQETQNELPKNVQKIFGDDEV